MSNPAQVASILIHDMGEDEALKYALRISRTGGPLSGEYAEAARIIEQRPRMCEECGTYPADGGRTCAGCDEYRNHTSVY